MAYIIFEPSGFALAFINDLFQLSSNIILMEHNWARLEYPIPCQEV